MKSDSRRISAPEPEAAALILISAGLFRSSFIGTAKRTPVSALGGAPLSRAEVSAKVSRPITPGTYGVPLMEWSTR